VDCSYKNGGEKIMINCFQHAFQLKYGVVLNSIVIGGQSSYSYVNIGTISRTSLQSQGIINFKFIERIQWSSGNNMAIAIGLNPSMMLPNNLDKTNELVAHAIYSSRSNYDGYFLFNLFPLVQTKNFSKSSYRSRHHQANLYYVLTDVIKDSINAYQVAYGITSVDVICFFGSSFYLDQSSVNNLNLISNANMYTIGTTIKPHHHPGRNLSVNTIRLNNRNSHTINVVNGHYR
jgi:hypothetical protein